jgi:hypothetical protein
MRAVFVAIALALCSPAAALAQGSSPAAGNAAAATPTAAPATAAPHKRGDITRDEYIERAKRNAERRFDRMDADHDGVLTIEERRAARAARQSAQPKEPQQ